MSLEQPREMVGIGDADTPPKLAHGKARRAHELAGAFQPGSQHPGHGRAFEHRAEQAIGGRRAHPAGGGEPGEPLRLWELGAHGTVWRPVFDRAQGRQLSARSSWWAG